MHDASGGEAARKRRHRESRRLHVFLISPMFPPGLGGGGMHAFYLAKALGERPGVRTHVFVPGEQLPQLDKHWFNSRRVNVHRTSFDSRPTGVPFAVVLGKCLEVYARVTSVPGFGRYEGCVVHGQHFSGILVGLHLKTLFGLPLVATLHKTPIGKALGNTVVSRDATYAHAKLLAATAVDAWVAGSMFFQNELASLGVGDRTRPILHGVPAQWLRSRAEPRAARTAKETLGLGHDDELIVCPVRVDRRKKPVDLLEAVAILTDRLPNRRLHVLVTGGDKEELLCQVSEEVRAKVAPRLIVKTVDFESFPSVLRSADLCVIPTIREGLGLSVLEALALDTPVVATDAEGVDEIITNEVSGCLYAIGQPDHLALMIERLLTQTAFRAQISRNGLAVVRRRFGHERMAREHEELYRSLLAANRI